MREFGASISSDRRAALIGLAQAFYERASMRRDLLASAFALDGNGERVVASEAQAVWDEGRMRVALSRPEARPPFEWIYEISSDINEIDYFKHYLIREDDIVLAQRKVLTIIDETEADVIEQDLREAISHLD